MSFGYKAKKRKLSSDELVHAFWNEFLSSAKTFSLDERKRIKEMREKKYSSETITL